MVRIVDIRLDGPTARGGRVHRDWVKVLADTGELDPVLVTHDGRLVDGRHRLEAAVARGEEQLAVIEVDVDDELEALVASARANAHRGLPMTTTERRALVTELLIRAPEWADRRIAAVAGVSPTTVGAVRRASGVHSGQRVGRDGRTYRCTTPREAAAPPSTTGHGAPVSSPRRRRGMVALMRWLFTALRRALGR